MKRQKGGVNGNRNNNKTPSPAPAGWQPAEWEVIKTSDEPFFEIAPLEEGNTYAFRGRARNSVG